MLRLTWRVLRPCSRILTLGSSSLTHSSGQSSSYSGPETEMENVMGAFPCEIRCTATHRSLDTDWSSDTHIKFFLLFQMQICSKKSTMVSLGMVLEEVNSHHFKRAFYRRSCRWGNCLLSANALLISTQNR